MANYSEDEIKALKWYLNNISYGHIDSSFNKCYGWTIINDQINDLDQLFFKHIEEHIIEFQEGRSGYTLSILIDSPEAVKKIIESLLT